MKSSSTTKKSWRQWLRIHPAAELFPPLSKQEQRALADDIKQYGLRQPVSFIKDVEGNPLLLDGINRLDALELLSEEIVLDNRKIFKQLPADIDADAFVVSQNIHRRHLTAEQKRELIGKRLVADPSKSNLQIAREVRADDKTVASVRRELEGRSEIPSVETRTDTRGRKQPAKVVATTNKKPRLSGWRSLQNKVRDLEAENRRLEDEATPLIPAWDKASSEQRIEFLKARRDEIIRAQHRVRKAYSGGSTDQNHAADTSRDEIRAAASERVRGPRGDLPPPSLVKTIADRAEATSRTRALQDDDLDIPAFLRRTPTGEPIS